MYNNHNKNSGFTLIELAIVLIIIGLIVTSILTAQTLIQNSKLLSVYDDINRFTEAYSSFRDSYKALPGDLGNIPGASFNTNGASRNNGIIEWDSAVSTSTESILAWHHLFIAGLIDFNPILTSANISVIDETTRNVPASKIHGAGYIIVNDNTNGTSTALKIHTIQLGTANGTGQAAALSGEDALFLDNKYDDGLPNSGSIRGFGTVVTQCVVAAAYQVGDNNTPNSCLIRFVLP